MNRVTKSINEQIYQKRVWMNDKWTNIKTKGINELPVHHRFVSSGTSCNPHSRKSPNGSKKFKFF